jgi:hypothetical protein
MQKFRKIVTITAIIAALTTKSLVAQVQINFQPSIHGKNLDGLTFFQVNNQTINEFNCSLRIIVTESTQGKVAEINVPSIHIKKGLNFFNRSILGASQAKFSSNRLAGIFKQTSKLPDGEYEYCYGITPLEDKPGVLDYYENCFQLNLETLIPLLLVEPADEEKICNQKPSFIWQPPMPVDINARYRITVAEIKDKQTAVEALSFSQPVINVSGLREARLNYPMTIKELEKNKTYAWQVDYSVNNVLITKSEIWTFKIDCEEEKEIKPDDSYRELKPSVNGDFYLAVGKLKFALNNPYNDGDLSYKIVNLKALEKSIQHLPKLKLITGLNKYELNLSEYGVFKNGEQYQLEVQLANGEKLFLRFTYQE